MYSARLVLFDVLDNEKSNSAFLWSLPYLNSSFLFFLKTNLLLMFLHEQQKNLHKTVHFECFRHICQALLEDKSEREYFKDQARGILSEDNS